MNPSPSSNPAPGTTQIHARVQTLRQLVEGEIRSARRKRKVYLTVGLCIGVLCILCLGNLTRLTFQLDASALTQIGRHAIERRLPDGRESAKSRLEQEAPRLVSQAIRGIMDNIPQFREVLLEELRGKTGIVTREFEEQLATELREAVRSSRAEIDRAFPDAPHSLKLEKLVASIGEQFEANINEAIQALYPEYSRQIEEVRIYLEHLRTEDPSKLTAKERIHKEIIETMLRLAAQEQAGTVLAG
ncbi:MAG: hypothetical protein HY721_33285 [Planctomycetes bacterium]|nr:hypothetical protein [Planctomycetota bacterium]